MNIKSLRLGLSLLALVLVGCNSQTTHSRLLDTRIDTRQASNTGAILAEDPPKGDGKVGNGADDAIIAKVSAVLLEKENFLQKMDHAEISARFFDHYLDSLDPLHLYFLQSDVKEFEKWRPKLDDMAL